MVPSRRRAARHEEAAHEVEMLSSAQPIGLLCAPGSVFHLVLESEASSMDIAAKHMKIGRVMLLLTVCTLAFRHAAAGDEAQSQKGNTMKIRLTINGKQLNGTLVDSETARDFASLLPLTVTLEDHAGTEKIVYLPRKLSTKGAPSGSDPSAGDIAYYAPWGNLALFYKDFR
jgi:hypothetical protein